MTLGPDGDTSHPFAYARIIGIFHVDVLHNVPGAKATPTSIEVLWVRWFRRDPTYHAGFKKKRLHRLEFLPEDDPHAFGFLNPDEVIRGSHLIPAFHHGTELADPDAWARNAQRMDFDWKYHYVNM